MNYFITVALRLTQRCPTTDKPAGLCVL